MHMELLNGRSTDLLYRIAYFIGTKTVFKKNQEIILLNDSTLTMAALYAS